jgi:DNA-binding response OmpR family regulator
MRRLLVVDDELAILEALQEVLSSEGYAVSTASNGAEGLQRATEERPDLVLLDLMMPIMDGWEMLRRMQEDTQLQHVPVIVMSAGRVSPGELKGLYFLAKPFDLDRLLVLVEQQTRQPQA